MRRPFRTWLFRAAAGVVASPLVPVTLRAPLYRSLGVRVGQARIFPGVTITSRNVVIGDGSFVNCQVVLEGSAWIRIGDRVDIGPGVTICTSTHVIGGPRRRAGSYRERPVVVGDGAWLGAGATLLPGAVVGAGAVVAAGATVLGEVPPHTLVAGTPAVVKRHLTAEAAVPGVDPVAALRLV